MHKYVASKGLEFPREEFCRSNGNAEADYCLAANLHTSPNPSVCAVAVVVEESPLLQTRPLRAGPTSPTRTRGRGSFSSYIHSRLDWIWMHIFHIAHCCRIFLLVNQANLFDFSSRLFVLESATSELQLLYRQIRS